VATRLPAAVRLASFFAAAARGLSLNAGA